MPWSNSDFFPITTHTELIKPEPELVLWRYMDLTKLLDILGNECLHFTRIDKFDDPFEGAPPRRALALPNEDLARAVSPGFLNQLTRVRKRLHALCWHANETESAAMWKLYLSSNEGIAIRTTAQRLRDSLRLTNGVDQPLFLAEVQYVNHLDNDEELAPMNFIKWATFKRKSFAHEREVRLMRIAQDDELGEDFLYRPKVDVNTLIDSIYIGPSVPRWVGHVIEQAVSRYGNFQIKRSELGDGPAYLSQLVEKLQADGHPLSGN